MRHDINLRTRGLPLYDFGGKHAAAPQLVDGSGTEAGGAAAGTGGFKCRHQQPM